MENFKTLVACFIFCGFWLSVYVFFLLLAAFHFHDFIRTFGTMFALFLVLWSAYKIGYKIQENKK